MEKGLKKKLSQLASFVANPYTFLGAIILLVLWIAEGWWQHYSDTWYKITNSVLELVTFLIVFIVQFSEENETLAIQKKLDSIVISSPKTNKSVIGAEKKFKAEK
jgi:low affinity Fe/Cu permease